MLEIDVSDLENFCKKLEKAAAADIDSEFISEEKVADTDLKALFDALAIANESKDIVAVEMIVEEIRKIDETKLADIEDEIVSRYADKIFNKLSLS